MITLTARQVLHRYSVEENLPTFFGMQLDDVNQVSPSGERPLDVAATRGSVDEVQALLDGGAEINAVGSMGRTALHEAVAQNHEKIVALLLERGASVTIRDRFNCTPIEIAQLKNYIGMINQLSDAR